MRAALIRSWKNLDLDKNTTECWTHKYRWECWPTTGCCSGRLSSFPQWARTQTGTRSEGHLRLGSRCPPGSRTGVSRGLHNSLCRSLREQESISGSKKGKMGKGKKKRIIIQPLSPCTSPCNTIYKGAGEEWASLVGWWRSGQASRATVGQCSQNHQFSQRQGSKHEKNDGLFTLIIDLKSNRAHTLIGLKVEPHLMGHADNQVRYKAASQPVGFRRHKRVCKKKSAKNYDQTLFHFK